MSSTRTVDAELVLVIAMSAAVAPMVLVAVLLVTSVDLNFAWPTALLVIEPANTSPSVVR